MFENDEELPDQIRNDSKPIMLSCHLNLANCFLQTEAWLEATIHAGLALKYEPNNTKALYRRGIALLNNCQFEEAKADLIKVTLQMRVLKLTLFVYGYQMLSFYKNYAHRILHVVCSGC